MAKANRGDLEIAILSTLEHQDRYGLEIQDTIDEKTKKALEFNQGSLYVAFKRLGQQGLIKGRWADSTIGGSARKYYKLTNKGRKALEKKRQEVRERRSLLDPFLEGA